MAIKRIYRYAIICDECGDNINEIESHGVPEFKRVERVLCKDCVTGEHLANDYNVFDVKTRKEE